MSNTINNGGHAFPHSLQDLYEPNTAGMTLRDYLAAKAMQGMAASTEHCSDGWEHSDIALHAYQLADARLCARGEA